VHYQRPTLPQKDQTVLKTPNVDLDIVQQEIDSLSLNYETGDRSEVARDLKRFRASDSPQDRAVVRAWDQYLRDRRESIAAAEHAKVDAASAAVEAVDRKKAEQDRMRALRVEAFAADPILELLHGVVSTLRGTGVRDEFVDGLQAKIDAIAEARQ
jgi:hypothetical protein